MLLSCFFLFLSILLHVLLVFSSTNCVYSYIQLIAASVFNKLSVSVTICQKVMELLCGR